MVLYKNNKIEIRKSPIHGYGVFTNGYIEKGEILEECNYVRLMGNDPNVISGYHFSWPFIVSEMKYMTIPFGFACVYNCVGNSGDESATWECDEERDIYVFKAIKDIEADTEILLYYGDSYMTQINFKINK